MLFKLRVLVKIVLTLVLLDHKLSYLHVLQCSHHSSSFFTIVFISFSPGDPLALGPLPLGYPNGKYNNNNNNTQCMLCSIMPIHHPYPCILRIYCYSIVSSVEVPASQGYLAQPMVPNTTSTTIKK